MIRQTILGLLSRLPQVLVAELASRARIRGSVECILVIDRKGSFDVLSKGPPRQLSPATELPGRNAQTLGRSSPTPQHRYIDQLCHRPRHECTGLIRYLLPGFPERQSAPCHDYFCLSLAGSILSQGSSGPNFLQSRQSAAICNRLAAILSAEPTGGGRRTPVGAWIRPARCREPVRPPEEPHNGGPT